MFLQAWALNKDRKDRSGSADPIQSTSRSKQIEAYLIFIIDLIRFSLIVFDNRILTNVWLFSVAEIISHYCTNFLLVLQAKCPKFFLSKAAKVALLPAM